MAYFFKNNSIISIPLLDIVITYISLKKYKKMRETEIKLNKENIPRDKESKKRKRVCDKLLNIPKSVIENIMLLLIAWILYDNIEK